MSVAVHDLRKHLRPVVEVVVDVVGVSARRLRTDCREVSAEHDVVR
jgi:hypothetical protein